MWCAIDRDTSSTRCPNHHHHHHLRSHFGSSCHIGSNSFLQQVQTVEGERSWFGALVKMAKGVDIGAHGNGISCVPCVGASPSLLLRGVLWKVSLVWLTGFFLCLGILSFSHVLQPSADVKFGSVFSGETEPKGHVSACSELESVELGGFVHTHSETFSVKGPHLIGFSRIPWVLERTLLAWGYHVCLCFLVTGGCWLQLYTFFVHVCYRPVFC